MQAASTCVGSRIDAGRILTVIPGDFHRIGGAWGRSADVANRNSPPPGRTCPDRPRDCEVWFRPVGFPLGMAQTRGGPVGIPLFFALSGGGTRFIRAEHAPFLDSELSPRLPPRSGRWCQVVRREIDFVDFGGQNSRTISFFRLGARGRGSQDGFRGVMPRATFCGILNHPPDCLVSFRTSVGGVGVTSVRIVPSSVCPYSSAQVTGECQDGSRES